MEISIKFEYSNKNRIVVLPDKLLVIVYTDRCLTDELKKEILSKVLLSGITLRREL